MQIKGATLEVLSCKQNKELRMSDYQAPTAEGPNRGIDMRQLFGEVKVIAVVGYSDNPERAGHYVAQFLAEKGYKIIAINPKFGETVDGLPNFRSLQDIPPGTQVDLIDVFRAPPHVPVVLEAALKMNPRPKYFVMQPGAGNPEVASRARQEGLIPLIDSCMMATHKIYMPEE